MTYTWTTPIRYVRGLGPTRSKELTKIGINTVGDLLEYPPLSWIYPGVTPISEASDGMVVIKAEIIKLFRTHNGAIAHLDDSSGMMCTAQWYTPWVVAALRPGMTATFYGKMKGGVLQQPKWTTVESTMENVYGGQYGVHHDTIRAALVEVLHHAELPLMYSGHHRNKTFRRFHFPDSKWDQEWATKQLKMDEAICLQLALAERRRGREGVKGERIKCDCGKDELIKSYFPYKFTDDQECSMAAIRGDLYGYVLGCNRSMQRLIHGEVGSGKTAVAFYAAMLAALNGKRTLILCPTTILADQHYQTLKGMGWDDVGLYSTHVCDLSAPRIVIGTHALLNKPHLLKSASLIIIDEFQKFGVDQRAKATKHNSHLLLMSATPIPRTLAATVFGDLDVSIIKELPIKRGTVITKWILPEKRDAMYEIIEKELAKGHQAYFVYPRISGDEDVVSAERGFKELSERWKYEDWVVKVLTGGSKNKTEIMQSFNSGGFEVLVSTIIAEVGLDNPNATVMVIEGADRFGLSNLHQLRGRVCRSTSTAFCFLVSETSNPTSIARLEVIEKCNDGFVIAEEDLRLRGAGEVFSTRQTGLPALRWCSLVDDYDLMMSAREIVNAGSVGSGVREMMELKYGESLSLGGVV